MKSHVRDVWALYSKGIDCRASLAWPKLHVKDIPCFAPFFGMHSSLSSSCTVHMLMHLPLSLLFPTIVRRPSTSIRCISTTSSTLSRHLPYYPDHLIPPTTTFFSLPLCALNSHKVFPWCWSCYALSSLKLLERTILLRYSRQHLGSDMVEKVVVT